MRKKKIAFITGITGQDGSYLAKLLLENNYKVFGLVRRSSTYKYFRLKYLNILEKVNFVYGEMTEREFVVDQIKKIRPDVFYNLAAQSFVKYSFDNPKYTYDVNYKSVKSILDYIVNNKLKIKFYQASTSEMYGNISRGYQDEKTKFNPTSPYASSKVKTHNLIKKYRDRYKLFLCSGILFNHESPLRGSEFVTKKIISHLVKMKKNSSVLELGNIYTVRDWGYAPEYVKAMYSIMEAKIPNDYVVATSNSITVKDFFIRCCKKLEYDPIFKGRGINEKCYDKRTGKLIMRINKKYFRNSELHYLKGKPSKIYKDLGFKAKITVHELINIMIEEEKNLTYSI
jgi:GDPmannose 4,6-dehydratase